MLHMDVVVIGGGIIGLATAYKLAAKKMKVVVLEKEPEIALHQSGRNSGVLHSGIYYKPNSLKAQNCRSGKKMMEEFCQIHNIPFERCGKLIVATAEDQLKGLAQLADRAKQNGIAYEVIEQITKIEPNAQGLRAIHLPETGIVDYRQVCKALAKYATLVENNVHVVHICPVGKGYLVQDKKGSLYHCSWLVNCAGLHSDRIARLAGIKPEIQIIPFRGDYYTLRKKARHLVKGLIYPVPDPNLPFLGVHFTKTISGEVECGPNALLAGGREAYSKSDFSVKDILGFIRYPGFWRLLSQNWWMDAGLHELLISISKRHYAKDLCKLVPKISTQDLIPRVSGIRAQAVKNDGSLVDDFVIQKQGRMVHVLNSPSPAATASLAIADRICSLVEF